MTPTRSWPGAPDRHRLIRIWGAALPLLAAGAGLLLLFDLQHHPIGLLLCLALAFGGLVRAARLLGGYTEYGLASVLLVSAVLRLLALPLPPTLSDDIYRYLWDGRVLAAGSNPYLLPPDSEALVGLRDQIWQSTSHREVPTVYPPLGLALFSIASSLPFPLLAYKLILSLIDLAGCAALLQLGRRLGLPASRPILYAWNPLVILEGAGMGHVDLIGVATLSVTLLCLVDAGRRSRAVCAGLAAACGVLIKLVPAVALPMWLRQCPAHRGRMVAAVAALLLPIGWLVLASTEGVPPGLVTYAISWEFNGPLFEPLWRAFDLVHLDQRLKLLLDQAKRLLGTPELLNPLYRFVYPQLLAKLCLAALLGVVIAMSLRERDPLAGTGRVIGRSLLLSATLYPWYLIWVLPCAALRADRAWLVLSASICLAYLPRLFGVPYFPLVYLLVWLPFLATAVLDRLRCR